MRRIVSLSFIALVVVVLITSLGCAPASPGPAAPAVQWPKVMALGTAKEGTDYYSMGVAMGRILSKYLPTTVTAQVSGGSFENIQRMKDGTRELAFLSGIDLYNSTNGVRDYEKLGKVPVRVITMGGASAFRIVTKTDLNIKAIPDLKGKIIEVATPGSVLAWDAMERIFKAYGMDLRKDSDARDRGSPQSSVDHVKEGKSHAFCTPGSAGNNPFAMILEASTIFNVYYIPVDKEKIIQINKEAPFWVYGEIPVGVDGQKNTTPVPVLWYWKSLTALPSLSDDVVYGIVKTIMEHSKEAGELYGPAGEFTLDSFASGLGAPFHTGAIKYFKEKGKWTPEIDALNQRLLKETGQTK